LTKSETALTYNWQKAYTGFNVRDCPVGQLGPFNDWIKAMRRQVQDETWLIFAEPAMTEEGYFYEYYCVDPRNRCIAWLTAFDGNILFQEVPAVKHWKHKRACGRFPFALKVIPRIRA
jgi:hypothetical protein